MEQACTRCGVRISKPGRRDGEQPKLVKEHLQECSLHYPRIVRIQLLLSVDLTVYAQVMKVLF